MENNRTLTVTQLNEYIKMMFDGQPYLKKVFVRGEISNFKDHITGHYYFSLKDETGIIRVVMFRNSNRNLPFKPENGMRVIITGSVSVYARDGQYQIYAENMEPDGVGALYVAYEQLKKKLENEGLFSDRRKRQIPPFPERIGIITSSKGAAVRDMINITKRRYPYAELVIYHSAVQGVEAVPQLIKGVSYFSEKKNVDVIIIGRGGGSIEDLWAFNDETLARTVAASDIPIISAVGHETDFTICDFVADLRAPTPSAAAELAVPDTAKLKRELLMYKNGQSELFSKMISQYREKLDYYSTKSILSSADKLITDKRLYLDRLSERLDKNTELSLSRYRLSLRESAAKLSALDPLAVISRGYLVVTDKESGKVIRSANDARIGQKIDVKLCDGQISAEICSISKTESTSTD